MFMVRIVRNSKRFLFFVWWSSVLFVDVFRWFDFIDTYINVNVRMISCVSLGFFSNAQGC